MSRKMSLSTALDLSLCSSHSANTQMQPRLGAPCQFELVVRRSFTHATWSLEEAALYVGERNTLARNSRLAEEGASKQNPSLPPTHCSYSNREKNGLRSLHEIRGSSCSTQFHSGFGEGLNTR